MYEKGVIVIKEEKVFTKDKKDLIFLHGYLSSKNSFSYQIPFFEKDFNVHAIDLKGFGENVGMEHPYSLDDYIREVEEYIEKNGLRKPCVIAHSFGGRIAIKLSAKKDIFDKIVLTGCAGLKPKRSFKYRLKRLTFKALRPFVKKKRLLRFYSKDYLSLSPVMRESFKKIVNEHLDCYLDKITAKTLIVFGNLDKETPIYMANKLNQGIKKSKLIIIEDAGHFCFIDKPFKFNMEVREFLLSKD